MTLPKRLDTTEKLVLSDEGGVRIAVLPLATFKRK
jgi:hypothetical protein